MRLLSFLTVLGFLSVSMLPASTAAAGGASTGGGGGRPSAREVWSGFDQTCVESYPAENNQLAHCFHLLQSLQSKRNLCGVVFGTKSAGVTACREIGGSVKLVRDQGGDVFAQCICR